MDYAIRPLTLSDSEMLYQFYRSLSPEVVHFYQPFPELDEIYLRNLLTETEAGKHLFLGLVDVESQEIIGKAFILNCDTPQPVFGIAVKEEAQGLGWGRKLMTQIMDEAKGLSLPLVTLTVIKENVRAAKLYESLGFVILGDCTFRTEFDSFYMERSF